MKAENELELLRVEGLLEMERVGLDKWKEKSEAMSREIIDTWHSMQGKGQLEAYRILERMVRRLGYGQMEDPSLCDNKGQQNGGGEMK